MIQWHHFEDYDGNVARGKWFCRIDRIASKNHQFFVLLLVFPPIRITWEILLTVLAEKMVGSAAREFVPYPKLRQAGALHMGALDCVRLGAALDTPGKRYAFPSPIPSHRYKRKLLACTSTFELIAPPLHRRTVSRAALNAAFQKCAGVKWSRPCHHLALISSSNLFNKRSSSFF